MAFPSQFLIEVCVCVGGSLQRSQKRWNWMGGQGGGGQSDEEWRGGLEWYILNITSLSLCGKHG